MKKVCFTIHLTNGKTASVVECYLKPEDEQERFPQWFAEALLTGLLITGDRNTRQLLIPMENVLLVERIPNYVEDEEDDEEDDEDGTCEDGKPDA